MEADTDDQVGPDIHPRVPSVLCADFDDGCGTAGRAGLGPIIARQFRSSLDDHQGDLVLDELYGG